MASGEGSEEGEIVFDDEQIILQQRIKELEARNYELEKISEISNQYRYGTDTSYRNRTLYSNTNTRQSFMSQKDIARIPSDASSISSDEMILTVKKRSKRRGRHTKKGREHSRKLRSRSRSSSLFKHNHLNKLHKTEEYCRKHNKLRTHKMKSPVLVNENYLETISLDSDEGSDHQKAFDNKSDGETRSTSFYLNREKLRFALARDRTNEAKTTGNLLKERLYNGNVLIEKKGCTNTCDAVAPDSFEDINNCKSNESERLLESSLDKDERDEQDTQEEQELRLIALKSAILKKHLERKKRNAEIAYSPTDFAPVPVNSVLADDNMDVVEEELNELNDVMDISPINSPKLVLTPSNDDDLSQCDLKINEYNNSMDMDIAQSGSEVEVGSNKNEPWYPIESVPITIQSAESNNSLKYPLPVHYGIYIPEMQYQLAPSNTVTEHSKSVNNEEPLPLSLPTINICDEEPPPPPHIYLTISDDEEEEPSQPPPSTIETFSKIFSDIKFDEEPPPPPPPFFSQNRYNKPKNNMKHMGAKTEDKSSNYHFNKTEVLPSRHKELNTKEEEDKDSDEEASALRAVLLSKLQASKSKKKNYIAKSHTQQFISNHEIDYRNEENENSDQNGLETVLQKALKRLKSSNCNSKEHGSESESVKEDSMNPTTHIIEVHSSNSEIEYNFKHDNIPKNNSYSFENNTDIATRNKLIRKIKNIDSKQRSNLDKYSITRPSSAPNIITESMDLHRRETDSCPIVTVEQNIEKSENNNSDALRDLSNKSEVNDVDLSKPDAVKQTENEIGTYGGSVVKDRDDHTPHETVEGTKENQEDALKQKSKQVKSSISKSSTSNEYSKTKEVIVKRKKVNPIESEVVATRTQPLTVKNNLIPSSTSTLKPSQNVVQSTVDKVRTTRTTKIVRPNKVINKEITTKIKRAMTPSHSPTPPAKIQRTTLNTSTKSANSTLSPSDALPKITVKKLIINLRASDTDSSDNELVKDYVPVSREKETYNEIASPLELLMDSGSRSPGGNKNLIKNDTSIPANNEIPKNTSTTNDAFEKKLDAFLKGIRKKAIESNSTQIPKISSIKKTEIGKNVNTPSAVRHLPLASQDEYRRLLQRMKLLERQKQARKSDEDVASKNTSKNIPKATNNITQTEEKKNTAGEENARNALKRKLQLKKLLTCENSFEQTSDNIVRLLNKSLSLVAEAKKTKIIKIRHEQRLQELRVEMAKLQSLFEQEERKFSNLRPQIGASNQFLTVLKKKRRNLMDNANKLGKSLKGDKYRLQNKAGEEIIAKSRKLHAEIKLVNLLKTDNIDTFLNLQSNQSKSSKENSDSTTNGGSLHSKLNTRKNVIAMNCSQIASPTPAVEDVNTEKVQQSPDDEVQKESGERSIEFEISSMKNTIPEHQTCHHQSSQTVKEDRDNIADKNSENQFSDTAEVVENAMRVELEVQHKDTATTEGSDQHSSMDSKSKTNSNLPAYLSPLDHFRHTYRNIDVNAIVCPYEMWGKCADESCSYMHMTIGKKRGAELAFTPINDENQ